MYTERQFESATERLKPYDALFGDEGSWARTRSLPLGGVDELIVQLHDYAEALKGLPLLPQYVEAQHKATSRVAEAIAGEPDFIRLARNFPALATEWLDPSMQIRPVTDEFHQTLVDAVPLFQRMCDLHASAVGLSPAIFETYRSDTHETVPGRTMGYADGRMGHPSGSTAFSDFPGAVMFVVHEGCHHIQTRLVKQLERCELEHGSWRYWQARIFQNDLQNGRGVDCRNFAAEQFGGDLRPFQAADKAYVQNPMERDAIFFGDMAENAVRRSLGLKTFTSRVGPGELGLIQSSTHAMPGARAGWVTTPSP